MKITFTTRSGSRYVIEKTEDAMTWERQQAGQDSVYVRTFAGTLLEWPVVVVGCPVEMVGPPLISGDVRYIYTTPVITRVEEP